MTTNLQPAPPADVADGNGPGAGLEDESRKWWFTFPAGHQFAGRYAVSSGTHEEARAMAITHFGETFAGQFASAEEARVHAGGLVPLGTAELPKVVDEPRTIVMPAVAPAADADRYRLTDAGAQALAGDAAQGVHQTGTGWTGADPGQSGVACVCAVAFDGFDSIAEAQVHLDRHIAAANSSALPPVPAGELTDGMFVATGNEAEPGVEVRHVEPSADGRVVGVLFAGPEYAEYGVDELVYLVDAAAVEQAAARARARAHRARQIEFLRQLAALAESDEHFPMPRYSLRLQGGMDSPEAVRRFAAALDVEVSDAGYGLRATWRYGGDGEITPPVEMEVSAPHRHLPAAKSTPVPVPVSPAAPVATAPVVHRRDIGSPGVRCECGTAFDADGRDVETAMSLLDAHIRAPQGQEQTR
ncbi:hypothetical protein [Micromonospora craniellae]|uniref:Uncharacterized protein n=1 Tax=Micromonospora craniellae TaxID=2294034 RepID=A0A372G2K3_9ACTN|nr:hypothetical protein [Micromonospora craniellae]QOC89851.1 hypothetical protein ID554_16570 [Micromonospora craniellae]RFS46999.1 hypothetical protein D0Q02_07500 [Micromonospora craniellae]